jgi:hypothetical protein
MTRVKTHGYQHSVTLRRNQNVQTSGVALRRACVRVKTVDCCRSATAQKVRCALAQLTFPLTASYDPVAI